MRHFYKTHGTHCYLRSFQTKCTRCGIDVLYWECRHGSKVFFNYPPYGKLIRHYCRHQGGKVGRKFPVIVKGPKGLLEFESPSCPVCGKLFKTAKNRDDHIKNLKNDDEIHKVFFENKVKFSKNYGKKGQDNLDKDNFYFKPRFGRINIKKKK
ncbi:MAG: hypothetical protein ACW986_13200 [Promethearchaeota archaeon]|jgi:hypothetical protein